MKVRIYLFHRVSPSKEPWALSMAPKLFEKCIRHITKNYEVATVEDVFQTEKNRTSNRPFACVTFDDGFKDNIEYAAPILKKYACPASFYIVTDCIDHNVPTWTHLYHRIFLLSDKRTVNLESPCLPKEYQQSIRFISNSARMAFGHRLYSLLKKIPYSGLQKILNQIHTQLNDVSPPENYMMNWNEINELRNDRFVIGSHTKTHPFLSNIENDNILRQELACSAERIRKMTGEFPVSLSYPVGDYDSRIKKNTRAAGYKIGLAVNQKFVNRPADHYEIPRVDLYADGGWLKTKLRMKGVQQRIKNLI